MTMSRQDAGKLGAKALNGDLSKKAAAARRAGETIKKKNPNFYSEIGRLGVLKRREKREKAHA